MLLEIITCMTCIVYSAQSQPTVNTPLGTIIGKTIYFHDIPVNTYQSIPYAKPPVDEYRFKKPQPVEKWTEPLVADHLPPGCIQYTHTPYRCYDDLPGKSQDCLYLNIWVPANTTSSDRKAIMFFVYGGGFKISSSRLDYYDGRALAALGDVLVVTTNYRLGPEGFLYFGTEDAPGNMGLYDILEALKWVHSNIEAFGGDKCKITLFGESAGAIAVSMLLVSPLAKNLFVRAILESGSAANLDAEDNDKDYRISRAIAKEVGCLSETNSTPEVPEIIACLRTIDALHLTKAVGKATGGSMRAFYPRYGDDILPSNTRIALIAGNFADVDILIGNNQREGANIITGLFEDVFGLFGDKRQHINKTFGEYILRKYFSGSSYVNEVIQHYLEVDEGVDVIYQVQSAAGDYDRVCPSVYLAETVASKCNNVFYYVFTQRASVTPYAPWMGVVHFDEIPFVFGLPLRYNHSYSLSDQMLSSHMIGIWTTFAKSGKVGLDWPIYSRTEHNYMELNTHHMGIRKGPHNENCEFYRKYFGF